MSNDANALKRKEQIKKILVYGGMVMLCLVSFYFIFKPSKEQVQAEQQKVGFNAELPDPRGAGIEADKIAAYELEDMRVKQEQKMRTLEDFTAMTTDDEEEEVVEIPEEPRYTGGGSSYRSGSSSRSNSFSSSTSAYNDINATLGSFYEEPREDPEKEALKAELEELKQSMAQQQNSQPTYADQVALLEKSYELAAKYMPSNTAATSEGAAEEVESTTRSGKAKAQPVGHVTTPVVSALAQPVSDSAMIARLSQSAGGGFIPPWVKHLPRLHETPSRRACMATRPSQAVRVCDCDSWRQCVSGSMYCHETPSSRVKAASKAKGST